MRVPAVIVVGLLLAVLINMRGKLVVLCRVIFYLPAIIPLVSASVLWMWLLSPLQGFVGPFFRENFAVVLPNWLHDENWALSAIVMLSVWQVGQTMMIFLAGLQEVPSELLEAAEMDPRFFAISCQC